MGGRARDSGGANFMWAAGAVVLTQFQAGHQVMKLSGSLLFIALAVPALALAQVQTAPLPVPDEPATRPDRAERQTGMVTFGEAGGQQVIIRSFEPTTLLSSDYSIDFEALDADEDGFISRREASEHPTLRQEFNGVDVDGDGMLSRDELRGWIR